MKTKPFVNIFVSSIGQNAGKTTVSLGLYKALQSRGRRITFMKPVGQEFVNVDGLSVDKDSYLLGHVYHIHKNLKDMSPITIGRGFTEQYILNPQPEPLRRSIESAFSRMKKNKDAIIVEGTGHAGVGSVVDLSNAEVASLLGSKAILIAEGGIGRSIDEVMLNKALFDLKGVEVLGVIVNKVLPEKYRKIKSVLDKGLRAKGMELLGTIPLEPLLISPTIKQVSERLGLSVLCGAPYLGNRVQRTIVAAMEPHHMIHYLQEKTLVVTSGDRIDNILVAVSSHLVHQGQQEMVSGIILTGDLKPGPKILDLLERTKIPVLTTQADTYTVAARMEHLICKIQESDKDKIQEATRLVEKYVHIDRILKRFDS